MYIYIIYIFYDLPLILPAGRRLTSMLDVSPSAAGVAASRWRLPLLSASASVCFCLNYITFAFSEEIASRSWWYITNIFPILMMTRMMIGTSCNQWTVSTATVTTLSFQAIRESQRDSAIKSRFPKTHARPATHKQNNKPKQLINNHNYKTHTNNTNNHNRITRKHNPPQKSAREACCSLLKNINVQVYERSGRRCQTNNSSNKLNQLQTNIKL